MIAGTRFLRLLFAGILTMPLCLYGQQPPLPILDEKEASDSIPQAVSTSTPEERQLDSALEELQKIQRLSLPIVDGPEGTDEVSPLFQERNSLQRTRKLDEYEKKSWTELSKLSPAVQPKQETFGEVFVIIGKQVGKVLRGTKEGKPQLSVALEPAEFQLKERREITVTVALKNESRRQIQLRFPTSQRIELLTRDQTGKVIERWSDDRMFDPLEGTVAINPDETVAYSERIPTREMKPGQTYTIEASIFNNPQFTKTVGIHPQ